MKAYIVGANLGKYTILKKIYEYLNNENIETEEVDWLSRKNIEISDISDGDIYIWVEINPLIANDLFMLISKDEDKKEIVNSFGSLLKDIKRYKNNNAIVEEADIQESTVEKPSEDSNNIKYDIVSVTKEKKSMLSGINVVIEGKEYYISKEDYDELYKIDEMLSKHGYKISSIAVEE
jgi:hypothetical protein